MAKTEPKRTTRTKVTGAARRRVTPADVTGAEGSAPTVPMKTVKRSKTLPADVSRAVGAALAKKAHDVVVLDLRNTPAFTDFFVLCSGLNTRQVKAIADAVDETLRELKLRPAHTEGYDRSEWVLMDYFNFIVHVFTPQTRAFYGLERLWGDAEKIEVKDEPTTTRSA
jgi:ribosome-associated protein